MEDPAQRRRKRRVGRPSGRRGKDTQAKILDAAEEAFAEVGFEGARLHEIAERAGVTKAMVHYYFDSKDKLYQAVLDRVLFELIKLVQDVTSSGGNRIEQLDAFIQKFFDYVGQHPHFARLGFAGGAAEKRYFDTIIQQFFHPLLLRGIKFINRGIEEGEFRRVNTEQLLFMLYFTATGYFSDARFISLVSHRDAMSPTAIAEARTALRDTFFHALGVDPNRPTPKKRSSGRSGRGRAKRS